VGELRLMWPSMAMLDLFPAPEFTLSSRMLRFLSRALTLFLTLLLAGVCLGLFLLWSQTRREYHAFEERRLQAESQLVSMRAEREAKEAYLRAFLSDPEFVDRVVRKHLGYVEPGEVVFRFQGED
jgi:cell division protein FtsB